MSGFFGGPHNLWREQMRRGRWLAATVTTAAIMALSLSPVISGKRAANRSFVKQAEASLVEPREQVALLPILVPREDVPAGHRLSAADFMPFEIPAAYAPKDVLLLSDRDYIEGKVAFSPLTARSLVSRRELGEELRPVFPFEVPAGYRAVSLEVDTRTSVEGHARPGTMVDVLWVYGQCGERQVLLAAREAKILSVAGSTEREARSPRLGRFTATLLVTEREAKALQLAAPGELAFALRGAESGGNEKNDPLNLREAIYPRRTDGSVDVCVVKEPSGGTRKYVFGEKGWELSL